MCLQLSDYQDKSEEFITLPTYKPSVWYIIPYNMSFNYFYIFAASQCQYFQGVPLCVHIVSKVVTYEEQGKKNNKMHACIWSATIHIRRKHNIVVGKRHKIHPAQKYFCPSWVCLTIITQCTVHLSIAFNWHLRNNFGW